MTDEEMRLRNTFEEIKKRVLPNTLTELHYGIIHRENEPNLIDYNTLVGFIDTASQFSVRIFGEGERALKCRIIDSLYSTINLLEETIKRIG